MALSSAIFAVLLPVVARAAPARAPGLSQVNARLGGLAVPFEANQGQLAPAVAFAAQTFYGTTFVTRDGELVHALAAPRNASPGRISGRLRPTDTAHAATSGPGWSLVERFVGAASLAPRGEAASPTRVSRFLGRDPSRWQSGLPTYGRVALGRPWPGIEVDVEAHGSDVEKIFTVAPGTDPGRIEVGVAGALALRLDAGGALVAETGNGPVRFAAPRAYQTIGGARRAVAVRYSLDGDDAYSFAVGEHDRSLPLTIDPILQSTYLGGGDKDQAQAVTLGASGHVIVAGWTQSKDFPGTAGGAQTSHASDAGNEDAFVARLSADLSTLDQATYLGGGFVDEGHAVAIDGSGKVIVAGYTESSDFPGTTGGIQASHASDGAGDDVFVARLSADLGTLEQATYLGGTGNDRAFSEAIDGSGNVFVAGFTDSTDFPGVGSGFQTSLNGTLNAFVARLTPDLTTGEEATYLGGTFSGGAVAVALDGSGHVFVAGTTQSMDFPGTAGGAQPSYGGGVVDGFVARLSTDLTTLDQATYLGGTDIDAPHAMAIEGSGDVLVVGGTFSTDFPSTTGGAQPSSGGGGLDGFVARLSPDLASLDQATYLGGSIFDEVYAVAIAGDGTPIVAGGTTSSDFPGTAGGAQESHAGGPDTSDAFVARLSPDLTTLGQATYLGGSDYDAAYALAIDGSGSVIVAGNTVSTSFPGAAGGAQPLHAPDGGLEDVFVARLTPDLGQLFPVVQVPALGGSGLLALGGLLALTGAVLVRRLWG